MGPTKALFRLRRLDVLEGWLEEGWLKEGWLEEDWLDEGWLKRWLKGWLRRVCFKVVRGLVSCSIFIVVISMCRMLFDRYSASLELGSPMLILGFKSDVALTN